MAEGAFDGQRWASELDEKDEDDERRIVESTKVRPTKTYDAAFVFRLPGTCLDDVRSQLY